jgi:hypothetical protein
MNRLAASGFREPITTAKGRLTPRLAERLQHVHERTAALFGSLS